MTSQSPSKRPRVPAAQCQQDDMHKQLANANPKLRAGDSFSVPGLDINDFYVEVPLMHGQSDSSATLEVQRRRWIDNAGNVSVCPRPNAENTFHTLVAYLSSSTFIDVVEHIHQQSADSPQFLRFQVFVREVVQFGPVPANRPVILFLQGNRTKSCLLR